MKKITGYIGALIIVMALMGSILAGYALNVNGESVVVNKYEKVTDVSGLYTHTDEKSYIEYNPASNYIGYGFSDVTFTNTANTTSSYKKITSGTVVLRPDGHVIINGVDNGTPDNPPFMFISKEMYVALETGRLEYYSKYTINTGITSNMTITFSNDSFTVTIDGGYSQTYTNYGLALAASTINADYIVENVTSNKTIYLNNKTDSIAFVLRPLGQIYNGTLYPITGFGTDTPADYLTNGNIVANGTYSYTIPSSMAGFTYPLYAFYPKTVRSVSEVGIDYTESGRVNNYPIEVDTTDMSGSVTRSVNLQAMSTTNYASSDTWNIGQIRVSEVSPPFSARFTVTSPYATGAIMSYRLSDILSTITIPQYATQIRIDAPAEYNITASYHVGTQYSGSFTLPDNFVVIGTEAGTVSYNVLTDQSVMNRTAYYNIDTGIVDIYTSGGVRVGTGTPDQIYVQFITNNATIGEMYDNTGGYYPIYTTSPTRPQPYLNMAITTSGTITNIHYMDITKGVSIKNGNPVNVIWNNNYENGLIKLLFRAEDVGATYHNDITVSGNTISIDYTTGRFYVTLNGGEPVDIGTWRNIVLNIDLLHGELSVNPVRTFNNYTNVVTDNATITVGNLTGTPTNIIEWEPTSNSFRFNIYSTDVFMDTYGVVMVNPELNITNYFTDLNQFYKLDFYNFSVYGDSITANGVTGTVSGSTITFNDESFILKDLSVIYADGHAYVEDSHISLDLGEITSNVVQFGGVWYFQTDLLKGYTTTEQIYEWNWSDFILDNTQFCVFYIGLACIGLIVARKFCTLSVIDYAVFITSIIIALSVQVIA